MYVSLSPSSQTNAWMSSRLELSLTLSHGAFYMTFLLFFLFFFFSSFVCCLSVCSDLDFAVALAEDVGKVMYKSWSIPTYQRKDAMQKTNTCDLVTETDQECERLILNSIRQTYPDHEFLAEENFSANHQIGNYDFVTDKPTWCIDPVDGTNNFVHQLPHVCVCIGLLINKQAVLGVVHSPTFGETYYAMRGGGAWLKTRQQEQPFKLQPNLAIEHVTQACIATEAGYDRTPEGIELMLLKLKKLLEQKTQSVRMYGSCALNMCAVAAGRADAYYEGLNNIQGPKPWDVSAASVIVTEVRQQQQIDRFHLNGRFLGTAKTCSSFSPRFVFSLFCLTV